MQLTCTNDNLSGDSLAVVFDTCDCIKLVAECKKRAYFVADQEKVKGLLPKPIRQDFVRICK